MAERKRFSRLRQFRRPTPTESAPTAIALETVRIPENSPSWTLAGNLSVTDPDADDTASFALVAGTGDDDNGSFSIAAESIYTSDALVAGSYSVRVRVTDSGSLTFDKAFTLTVVADSSSILQPIGGSSIVFREAIGNTVAFPNQIGN